MRRKSALSKRAGPEQEALESMDFQGPFMMQKGVTSFDK